MGKRISRAQYAELFGPTTGDRVRLGDTELWAEVERDLLVPGDECVFGGGKPLRDGLGTHGASPRSPCTYCMRHGAQSRWSAIARL